MHEVASFGQWLRQRRRALLLTQEDLAERIACSSAMVRKIEAGERVASQQMADLLAESFGVVDSERPAFSQFAKGRLSADAVEHALWQTQRTVPARPTNLAAPLTALIGREQDLETLRERLLTEGERLFTLTGAPGIGKTRLSLQAGIEVLDHFEDGVFFVSLAPVSDPQLVVTTISRSLGLKEIPDLPLFDSLATYLGGKRLLLILDNFEQVLEAAPYVAGLLETCPGLKVLVTSREALHVRGEQQVPVPPLRLPDLGSLPDAQALMGYPAVALFVERARAAMPRFQLADESGRDVATICHRLDGLPLAIELAAARINLLSPRAIAARLGTWPFSANSEPDPGNTQGHTSGSLNLLTGGARDLPRRQQTLRRALEWSYNLLDGEEQTLFARMGVFVGGCTLQAVEAVCNARADLRVDMLDGVASLLGKNLVRQEDRDDCEPGERRFRMLETLHEYAREKLEENGESDDLYKEHALYFMRLAEEADPQLTGAGQQEWLDRLEDEHDNLSAALRWARGAAGGARAGGAGERGVAAEAMEIGLRTGAALRRFWDRRCYLSEGREHLMRLLEMQPVQGSQAAQGAGGEPGEGCEDCEDCEQASHPEAQPGQLSGNLGAARAKALIAAGYLAYIRGDFASARSLYEDSLALHRDLGDTWGIATSLGRLGDMAREQGDDFSARSLLDDSLALFRELGDKWGITISLERLGDVAKAAGDYASARSLYEDSLAMFRERGDTWCIANLLCGLADMAREEADYACARSLLEESLVLRQDLGDKRGIGDSLNHLGRVAQAEGDYASARSLFEESLALFRERGDKKSIGDSLNHLGRVAQAEGDYASALSFFERSLVLRRDIGDKRGIALLLSCLGGVIVVRAGSAGQTGVELQRGTRLLGAAEGLLEAMGAVLFLRDRVLYERAEATARSLLGEEAFERAKQEGRAMSMEEAVLYALEGS